MSAVPQANTQVSANPLAQEVTAQVEAKLVEMSKVTFNFRSTEVPDPTGATVEVDGKQVPKMIKWKRPSLELMLPMLTTAGVIAALSASDKTTDLVKDAANAAIIDRARGLINDTIEADAKVTLGAGSIDVNTLNLVAIANLPKGERGAGIAKEIWAGFVADYKEVMSTPEAIESFPDKTARPADVLEKHAILLAGKFNQVRSRKDVVAQMLGFLDIWVMCSKNAEEYQACYDLLKSKGDAILQGEDFNDL